MFFDMLVKVGNAKKICLAWGKHYFGQKQKFGKDSKCTDVTLKTNIIS